MTRTIFDQNDRSFYPDSPQRLVQFPAPGQSVPFGQFAVYVGLEDAKGGLVNAVQPKPASFSNLRTGYYVVPQPPGGPLNAFGLVINADDPHNHHGDISYVMPCVWLSSVTMPQDRILRPWREGFDSIEYSVDMRVPFANSPNVYHPYMVDDDQDSARRPDLATPYVLGGLYFEQLKKLGGKDRPPAFWIAVTMFDLRKHYSLETLLVDDWSGGTNYPIVTTTIGRDVHPDNGIQIPNAPPKTALATNTPIYSLTLSGSESMQTESHSDGPFRHFAFRVTREHFLAAVDGIRMRMPHAYGEHGSAPMSSEPSDWGLTYFNLDAEIFHQSTYSQPLSVEESRAMVVEFKNLKVQQAIRSPKRLTVRGALEKVDGTAIQGYACFDADPSESRISVEQLVNLRETPVSVELVAIDPSGRAPEVSLGRVSARDATPNSATLCPNRRNGHGFNYHVPLERILKIDETGDHMIIKGRAFLKSGEVVQLQDPPSGPIPVPTVDIMQYASRLIGRFDGVKGRTATGWVCIPGKEDLIPVDILSKQLATLDRPGTLVSSGYADAPSQPIKATWDACGSHGPHTFRIDLPPGFELGPDKTLVAVARLGNVDSPSSPRPWDRQLAQADPRQNPIHLGPPTIKGYFESVKTLPDGALQLLGWACLIGMEEKLNVRILGVMSSGRVIQLKETVANHASEAGVQGECQILNAARDPEVRPDGKGFRFDLTLQRTDVAKLTRERISDFRVEAFRANGSQPPVNIAKVPGWKFLSLQRQK